MCLADEDEHGWCCGQETLFHCLPSIFDMTAYEPITWSLRHLDSSLASHLTILTQHTATDH